MDDAGNDWGLWRWGLGVVGSIIGGTAMAGWIARGKIDDIVREQELIKQQQARCQGSIKDEIKSIVQQAVDQHSLLYADHLSAIRTDLAVIAALHGETQQDVKSIFARLDRRVVEAPLPPHGERRGQP